MDVAIGIQVVPSYSQVSSVLPFSPPPPKRKPQIYGKPVRPDDDFEEPDDWDDDDEDWDDDDDWDDDINNGIDWE